MAARAASNHFEHANPAGGCSMKRFSFFCLLVVFATACLFLSEVARAQEAAGKVVGTVFDQQGAVIPGAKVTVKNVATGVTNTGVTDDKGYFEVLALPIGSYNVTVEKDGFERAVTQSKELQINQTLRFDITLKVGAASESVTVEAQVSGVETENPTVGGTVIGNEVQEAPLNGRNVLDLALLQPGVTPANPTVGGFSIGGGRMDSVTYLLDGGLNNDLLDNSVVYNPNPDSIAEFRILTSNYTAEYGRNGAGVISVVTKSGTNSLHGSAYDYVRNGDFDANKFFNNINGVPRLDLKRHQFGATLGGPITIPHVVHGHDKLFFFASYQGQRETEAETQNQVPTFTPAEEGGDFSQALPFGQSAPLNAVFINSGTAQIVQQSAVCGVPTGCPDPNVVNFLENNPFFQSNPALQAEAQIDPTKIDPVATAVFGAMLIPTSSTGLITSVANLTDNYNELTGKVDYVITPKDKFSFMMGGHRDTTVDPFAFSGPDVSGFPDLSTTHNYFLGLSYVRTFSAEKLNEFHANVQRNNILQVKPDATDPSPAALGFGIIPDLVLGPPQLTFDTGLTTGFSIQGPSNLIGNTFAYRDVFTLIKGNNTWSFGGGFSDYQQNMVFDFFGNSQFAFVGFGGNGSGNSFADFLLGIPNFISQGPNAPSNIRQKTSYAFGQDQWRVNSHLTVTLGLRYEYSSPKLDTRGRTFAFVPGKQSTMFPNAPLGLVFPGDAGVARGVNFPDKDNFAPRFGFAWDPTGAGKTSIRGGGGIFYDVLKAEDNFQFNGQPPFFADEGLPFPFVGAQFTGTPAQAGPTGFYANPWTSVGLPANPFPSVPPTSSLNFINSGFIPFAPIGGVYDDQHLHTPYVYQYNLSIQHQLAKSLIGEINYVGSSSKGLTGLIDINPFVLGTSNRVQNVPALAASSNISAFCNSVFGASAAAQCPFPILDGFDNISFASFNSIESSLTKQVGNNRFIGNTYFTLAYTYGRSIDNASGFRNNTSTIPFYDHSAFRGPSDFDVTHRVVLSGAWDLPFDQAWSSGPKKLIKGWTLYPIFSYRSGFPLTVGAGLNPNLAAAIPGPSGAGDAFLSDAVFGPSFSKVTTLNPKAVGNFWFNPATFSQNVPATDPYGLPRGIFRGPGATNLDLALSKHTQIYENLNLELRLEAFNVFNHAEFDDPDLNIRDIASGTFGKIQDTADPRIVQIAARLTF
jgi:outer membrane receptor protein involved in Fe transport